MVKIVYITNEISFKEAKCKTCLPYFGGDNSFTSLFENNSKDVIIDLLISYTQIICNKQKENIQSLVA